MKKKTTGFIAGAAGVALLVSGSTFALWSDDADVDGVTISSGNLDVAVLGEEGAQWSWQDISDDRGDSPHDINLSTFRMVPGDTIEGTIKLDVGLQGDNMAAILGLDGGTSNGDLDDVLDISVQVKDGEGDTVGVNPFGSNNTLTLYSSDNGNTSTPGTGDLNVGDATDDGTGDLTVTVTATFPDQTNRHHTQESVTLSDPGVSLTQTRDASVTGFN